ncbi:T9SS type A sorting domain-containing protein [Hymenobacter glacialis]|uniref:T9SS type A sorting domain-containing protein n=1 Tax=Hymenobacter glacialis TaxID=1908236 RepID=UPI0019D33566|nr:T9SS type A sorting domain-containing protein [Hymenobacter glacialis]
MLKVPALSLPQSPAPNQVARFAVTYRWIIPSGWRYTDATGNNVIRTSDGTTAVDVTDGYQAALGTGVQGGNQIRVLPAPSTGGTISVQAIDNTCSGRTNPGATVNSISRVFSTTVNRPTPALTIVSNRTPQGGPLTLFCGESLSDQQVRYLTGPVPAGGGFSSPLFAVSGVVRSFCCLNSNNPGLTLNGVGTGSIGLTATYTRNGASTTVTAAPVAVTVRSDLAPPVFTALPNLCQGETKTLRVAPVPGAQSYQWTLPSSFLTPTTVAPTAPGSYRYITQGPEITVTASSAPYSSGSVLVDVVAGGSGCGSSSATGSVIVGLGDRVLAVTPSPGSVFYYDQVCANQPIQFTATIDQQQATDVSYSWEVDGVAVATSGSTINAYTPGPGQSISVSVTASSACGSLIATRTLYAASSIDGQPCEAGAYRTTPAPEAVYPNPADDKLYVQQGGGEVTLYNLQGQPVSHRSAKPGLIHLNTKHLPTGLYILHYPNATGQTVRQQVRIEH